MYLKVIKYIYTAMLQCFLFLEISFFRTFALRILSDDVKKDDGEPSISLLDSKPGARAQTARRDGPGCENPQ